MVYGKHVQIGRVVLLNDCEDRGKICTIVEIIDANRALIDGPCTGVKRQPMQFKHMHLTKWVLPILHGARTKTVLKAWETAKITEEWEQSAIFKKLKMQETRAKLTDFDRFKLMKAKQMRNRLINVEYVKLRKAHNKNPPKPKSAKKAKKPAAK